MMEKFGTVSNFLPFQKLLTVPEFLLCGNLVSCVT